MTAPQARNRAILCAALATTAIIASCSKKVGISLPVAPPVATATFTGLVLSGSSGLPLPGVTVSSKPSAGGVATSNSSGIFTLSVPVNALVAITLGHSGFSAHPVTAQLAAGETRATTLVLAAVGTVQAVLAAAGGKVTDGAGKTALTLPANFVTGTSSAQINVTGLDPTSSQVLAMPGTFAALSLSGAPLSLEPVALAEITAGDGAGGSFALAMPCILELHIPAALVSDPRLGSGNLVPCLRYDETKGAWQAFADGIVVASSVDGQPAVRVTVDRISWFAAGFLNGSNGCVRGVVTNNGVPVAGASVQAYPGGSDVSKTDGSFRVSAPPDAAVSLVAARSSAGALRIASAAATAGGIGGACSIKDLALQGGPAPATFSVYAQLMVGRDGFGILRHEALVKIVTNNTPSPTLFDGARVELGDGISWRVLPRRSPGVYGIINGQSGTLGLDPGTFYDLRIDVEPDGTFDGTARVQMPGRPVITAPAARDLVNPSFNAGWSDPALRIGYSARYIGSFELTSFGQYPARFALSTPSSNITIGTGVGQSQYGFTNDPLPAGGYTFRLWATNGPVRYPVGPNIIFADPNIANLRMTGWFSAIAQAESIEVNSLGEGTGATAARRVRR